MGSKKIARMATDIDILYGRTMKSIDKQIGKHCKSMKEHGNTHCQSFCSAAAAAKGSIPARSALVGIAAL